MVEKKEIKIVDTMYDIFRHPIVSEKVAKLSEQNKLAFVVDMNTDKNAIKEAFVAIYGIKPLKINTLIVKGKEKTFRNKSKGIQKAIKKVYISLPKDAKIDLLKK